MKRRSFLSLIGASAAASVVPVSALKGGQYPEALPLNVEAVAQQLGASTIFAPHNTLAAELWSKRLKAEMMEITGIQDLMRGA